MPRVIPILGLVSTLFCFFRIQKFRGFIARGLPLGTALFRHGFGFDALDRLSPSLDIVLIYTWVHGLVFCVIGAGASKLITLAVIKTCDGKSD